LTKPWSQPKSPCGFDLPPTAPPTHHAARHSQPPGPTEHHLRPLPPGCSRVKTPQRRTTRNARSPSGLGTWCEPARVARVGRATAAGSQSGRARGPPHGNAAVPNPNLQV
jgi:hypothetical protein